jgi:hypothetical protein
MCPNWTRAMYNCCCQIYGHWLVSCVVWEIYCCMQPNEVCKRKHQHVFHLCAYLFRFFYSGWNIAISLAVDTKTVLQSHSSQLFLLTLLALDGSRICRPQQSYFYFLFIKMFPFTFTSLAVSEIFTPVALKRRLGGAVIFVCIFRVWNGLETVSCRVSLRIAHQRGVTIIVSSREWWIIITALFSPDRLVYYRFEISH